MNSDNHSLPEIRVLPENVANQIAAGEVVERPAAVVKELVENAIDAGATRIEIEFKRGGKSFIKVSDNGCGMSASQALLCIEPHATSKIRTHDDLKKVSSFGFRGEALPSIASVSFFTLKTRAKKFQTGTEVRMEGGRVMSTRDCGMAVGTEIVVENLFSTVPARRKFLKSDNVEASHIVKLCRLYALALPNISFSLVENSRELFKSEKNSDVVGRVDRIFGREISEKIIPLAKVSRGAMSVEGALLKPGEYCASNRFVCVYLNSRPVDLRAANSALKEAYGASIPKGRYAAAFLFITMNPEDVDVNVHPAKREVRVRDEFALRDFLISSISKRLESFGSSSSGSQYLGAQTPEADAFKIAPRENIWKAQSAAAAAPPTPSVSAPARETPAFSFDATQSEAREEFESPAPAGWEFLAFYKKNFILFQTDKALVCLNVRSALKRINYERIVSNFEGSPAASQALLIPINISLDRAQGEFFASCITHFERCGFELDVFGRDFFRLRAIPDWLDYSSAESFVKDFIEEAFAENMALRPDKISAQIFAKLAISRAFGATIHQTRDSALSLLRKLLSCAMPMLSPDGKPTTKELLT